METLTVQAYLNEAWTNIALINFPGSQNNDWNTTQLDYLTEYAINFLDNDDFHAVSVNHPVSLFLMITATRLAAIYRRYHSRRSQPPLLDKCTQYQRVTYGAAEFLLLKYGTMSPVGNLRIKESVPEWNEFASAKTFTVADVIDRAADFLDYAQERGAAAGGATGAGGEAPKLLLRCSETDAIWIDTWQNEPDKRDRYYLVKYPRGNRTEVDCNILRAEFHYYHELSAMGVSTIPIETMRLEEGATTLLCGYRVSTL